MTPFRQTGCHLGATTCVAFAMQVEAELQKAG